jgi:sec-independent protein translocase protein TatA
MLSGHLPELVAVLMLALIVFGPKRLPEIGGAVGKSIRDFKQGISSLDADGTDAAPLTGGQAIEADHAVPVQVDHPTL